MPNRHTSHFFIQSFLSHSFPPLDITVTFIKLSNLWQFSSLLVFKTRGIVVECFILYVYNCVKQTAKRHTRAEKPIGWFPRPTIKPQFSQHRCVRSHDAEVLCGLLAVRWWCLRWGYRWRWRWWWLDWLVSGDRMESVTGDWWRLLSPPDCTPLHASFESKSGSLFFSSLRTELIFFMVASLDQ